MPIQWSAGYQTDGIQVLPPSTKEGLTREGTFNENLLGCPVKPFQFSTICAIVRSFIKTQLPQLPGKVVENQILLQIRN